MAYLSHYLHGRYPAISHLAWIALWFLSVGMSLIFTAHVSQPTAGADESEKSGEQRSEEWSALFIPIIVDEAQSVGPVMMID